jgi:uncharacterized membrane protein YfcA
MASPFFVTPILFLASFVSGTVGFGFALVAVPLLSLLSTPTFAVPFALLSGYIINLVLLVKFKEHIQVEKLFPLLAGALPGIPLGVYLLRHLEGNSVKTMVGGILILFSLWNLLGRREEGHEISRSWAYVTGFSSGLLAGATAMSGPPLLIYLSLSRWEKNITRATLQSFFLVTDACSIIGLAMAGVITSEMVGSMVLYLPAVMVGGATGYLLFKKLNLSLFYKIVLYLLLAMGMVLICL